MSRKTEYDSQASAFADDLSHLLNNTITTGIRIRSVLAEDARAGWVGYRIGSRDYIGRLIPVKLGKEAASCYLRVGMTLQLDPEVKQLVVAGSNVGLFCHDDVESMVFHYDFEREPQNDYPLAHFQVAGDSPWLNEICRRVGLTRTLPRFHFPVGGKRYRPTVEDVIEFLAVERVARVHDRWTDVLEYHRRRWERIQLLSVVRRDPESAAEELRRQGYSVGSPPDDGGSRVP